MMEKPSRPLKRKAEQAFSRSSSKQAKLNKKPSNKIVNFQHLDQNVASENDGTTLGRSNTNSSSTDGRSESGPGKLKRRAQALEAVRQSLPIHPHADEIKTKLVTTDVLLLVGETGSGKSTQVPQFLLNQSYARKVSTNQKGSSKKTIGGCIAITQPRRVAAISLAKRVAEEIGTPLGNSSPASQVGYSVRFDSSTGPNTKIKFVTDGMLLQELLRDPWLTEYSVVVVDEVHERGVNVDLVMGFLRRIIQGRNKSDGRNGVPLKVVVMSATADMERIEKFFSEAQEEEKQHTNGIVKEEVERKEEEEEFQGFSNDEKSGSTSISTTASARSVRTASCFIKGRQFPVTVDYTSQPVESSWDAALERIIQIHQHTPLPGDILVFLPGQEAIDSLESMCNTYANELAQKSKQKGAPKVPKLLILPLFAALPTAAQQRVFEPTPSFTRKVILSTNIAETSVTVPGVRHVIDTGKRKARFFRPSLNLDTLLTKPISRSSAKQRAGRAGREAPGTCWRLYTEKTFYELEADTEPEILRCDLSQLVLTLKAHNVDDILSFPFLTSPPVKALERALLHLLQLGALDISTGTITELGRRMCRLPVPANLARILLASKEPQYDCADEIIDIVSGLSVENIWLPIHNRSHAHANTHTSTNSVTNHNHNHSVEDNDDDETETNLIQKARSTLHNRQGDHLTLLTALQTYTRQPSGERKPWCQRHGISHRAISAATDVSKQLRRLLPPSSSSSSSSSIPLDQRILRALLTGLFTNTARLTPHTGTGTGAGTAANPGKTGQYTTYFTAKPIQIHPGSVLFSRDAARKPTDIVFSEFVYTARPYARGVSEVQAGWIEDVMKESGAGTGVG